MFKQAWRSYLESLHPRNYKYAKNLGFEIIWCYSFVLGPMLANADKSMAEKGFQFLFLLTVILPYFIMYWSDLAHKLSMPKVMYMLPMKLDGRKEYLNTLLAIKIGFPTLVHVILQFIHSAIYGMDWLEIVLSTFAVISFGIGRYVCSQLRSKFDRYIKYAVRGKDGTGKDAWLNWMCMIYAVIYRVFVMMGEIEGGPDWIFILCFLSIMVILDIAIIKTRYQATIEDVCDYEEAFNILGRVKK